MSIKTLLFCSLLIVSYSLPGQNYRDSIQILAREMAQDSNLIQYSSTFIELDSSIQSNISDTSIARLLSEYAIQVPNDPRLSQILERLANFKIEQNISQEERLIYIRYKANALVNQASYLEGIGKNEQGLKLKYQGLRLQEQSLDTLHMILTLISIGVSHFNLRGYEDANNFWREALVYLEIKNDTAQLSQLYSYLGIVNSRLGQDSLAEFTLQKSLDYASWLDDPSDKFYALENMGEFYVEKGDWSHAIVYLREAATILRNDKEYDRLIGVLYSQFWAAIELNYIKEAEACEREARQIITPNSILEVKKDLQSMTYRINKIKGNYDDALKAMEAYNMLYDSINQESSIQALAEQKYARKALTDSLNNVAQLVIEQEVSKRRTTLSYVSLAGLAITLIFAFILFNRFRLTNRQKKIIESEKEKLDQANVKLKELDGFKSQFFTNISHEFRTPLTVIQGMAEQVREKPEKWLEKGTNIIYRNTTSLLNLINQILDLRKIESGTLSLNLVQDDVVKYLRFMTSSFESMAESKEIALTFESQSESLLLDFDPEKLGQIIYNLISNALKFTPKKGKVIVAFQNQTNTQYLLSVEDSGIGIPPEKLPFIFDQFYQADNSSTREGEGTGIGLSLTQELVHLMKGEISVKSDIGKGSRFEVLLPITNEAPVEKAATHQLKRPVPLIQPAIETTVSASIAHVERPSLLIIEDNPDIVQYLFACLEDQYDLFSASDGQAGIDAAFEQVPDIIITDVMMPRKNGYEVCETLKLDERTSHIPIVMLTAKADQPSRLEGYKRGADAYLAKPFDRDELLIRISALLASRKALQRRYQSGELPSKTQDPIVQAEDEFIIKVRQLIIENLDDHNYRGESICKDIGVSRTNLHRKIKALTGHTTSHFIRTVRLTHSKKLLLDSTLDIAEIAYSVGFSNPSYFIRIFGETEGIPPGEWREQAVKKE